MKIGISAIGKVSSQFKSPKELHFACERGRLAETESEIVLDERLSKGLAGIEDFSHIWVIYFLHDANRIEMKTHPGPPEIEGLPKVGVFASRSQYRPNHIALRLVELSKVESNKLHIKGLDAIDGTPVLDIKPFIPHFDKPENERIANWYKW